MIGGQLQQGRKLYESFVEVAKKHLFYRPMSKNNEDLLLSGTVRKAMGEEGSLETEMQHLTCFIGGVLALAGKTFKRDEDVKDGARLARGCVWAYKNTATGIMPETFTAVACKDRSKCSWNETEWRDAVSPGAPTEEIQSKIDDGRLPKGFSRIQDRRYLLRYAPCCVLQTFADDGRPEAIESVFILHRITGDKFWAEAGWDMFQAVQKHTKVPIAHSAIDDVTKSTPDRANEMESFWLAETLKYFYLLFSDPSVIDLDEYVL
jgi:mannosyl-oligosaccharide alpha-1,2-mannosidase